MSWTHGEGPEVHATGEAMLLMMTGRHIERSELSGPAAEDLWTRIRSRIRARRAPLRL